jgi:hypothetical protein
VGVTDPVQPITPSASSSSDQVSKRGNNSPLMR